jgi:hypothetical protein
MLSIGAMTGSARDTKPLWRSTVRGASGMRRRIILAGAVVLVALAGTVDWCAANTVFVKIDPEVVDETITPILDRAPREEHVEVVDEQLDRPVGH